jgi:hypothetical protein
VGVTNKKYTALCTRYFPYYGKLGTKGKSAMLFPIAKKYGHGARIFAEHFFMEMVGSLNIILCKTSFL